MKKAKQGAGEKPAPPPEWFKALDSAQDTIERLEASLKQERADAARLRKQLAAASPCPALDAWVMEGLEGRTWETGRTGGRCYVMLRASGGPAGGIDRAYGETPDAARAAMAQALSAEHLKSILPDGGPVSAARQDERLARPAGWRRGY